MSWSVSATGVKSFVLGSVTSQFAALIENRHGIDDLELSDVTSARDRIFRLLAAMQPGDGKDVTVTGHGSHSRYGDRVVSAECIVKVSCQY